jgi:hypothetical protein
MNRSSRPSLQARLGKGLVAAGVAVAGSGLLLGPGTGTAARTRPVSRTAAV